MVELEKERQTYRQTNRLKPWSVREPIYKTEQRRLQYSPPKKIGQWSKAHGKCQGILRRSVLRANTVEGCD